MRGGQVTTSNVASMILDRCDDNVIAKILQTAIRTSKGGWGAELQGPYRDPKEHRQDMKHMGKWPVGETVIGVWPQRTGDQPMKVEAVLAYHRGDNHITGTLKINDAIMLSERNLILLERRLPETVVASLMNGKMRLEDVVSGIPMEGRRVIHMKTSGDMTSVTMDVPDDAEPLPERYLEGEKRWPD